MTGHHRTAINDWRRGGKIGILEREPRSPRRDQRFEAGRGFRTEIDCVGKAMCMTATWKDVRRASIPAHDLPVLAELRGLRLGPGPPGRRGCLGLLGAGFGPDAGNVVATTLAVIRSGALQRARGIVVSTGRALALLRHARGRWIGLAVARADDRSRARRGRQARGRLLDPVRVCLVRDAAMSRTGQRRCDVPPNALAAWAERATSAELASLKGAWIKPAAQGGSNGLVLVTGAIGSLPLMTEGVRFWGAELLIPLGFKAVPDLPPAAIRAPRERRKTSWRSLTRTGSSSSPGRSSSRYHAPLCG